MAEGPRWWQSTSNSHCSTDCPEVTHLEAQPSGCRNAECLRCSSRGAYSPLSCSRFGGEAEIWRRSCSNRLVQRRNTVQMVCIADPASRLFSDALEGGSRGFSCRGLAVISSPNGPPGRNRLEASRTKIGTRYLDAANHLALQRRESYA
jgi:hypothetical protein